MRIKVWRVFFVVDAYSVEGPEVVLNYSGHLPMPSLLDNQGSGFDDVPWFLVVGSWTITQYTQSKLNTQV